MPLGLGHEAEDGEARVLDRAGQPAALDDGADVREVAVPVVMGVVVMPVAVAVVVMMVVVQAHVHPRAVDAAAGVAGDFQLEFAVDAELGQFGAHMPGVRAQVDHGRQVHDAADAGEGVVEENFHGLSPPAFTIPGWKFWAGAMRRPGPRPVGLFHGGWR